LKIIFIQIYFDDYLDFSHKPFKIVSRKQGTMANFSSYFYAGFYFYFSKVGAW